MGVCVCGGGGGGGGVRACVAGLIASSFGDATVLLALSVMPKRVAIARAILVAVSKSLAAPANYKNISVCDCVKLCKCVCVCVCVCVCM